MKLQQNINWFRKLPGIGKFSVVTLFSIGGIFIISIFQGMLFNSNQSNNKSINQNFHTNVPLTDLDGRNYRLLRKKAIDSLIDNKKLTPENLALIRQRFPDSLCDCN